jgi:transcriptional regulator with XRE-family HTH domain
MNTTSKMLAELNKKMQEFDLNHERVLIQLRFMSEVEKEMEKRNMTYKQLAEKIGTSASYITQLFRATKKLNLDTIAKFQVIFEKTFDIELKDFEQIANKKEKSKFVILKFSKKQLSEKKQIAV